jgi:addiction module RelB/DinJ family antitoxin
VHIYDINIRDNSYYMAPKGVSMTKNKAKVRLVVRIDSELKDDVDEILLELGLKTTDMIRLLYKQIVKQRKIPFNLSLPQITDHKTLDEMIKKLGLEG